MNFIDYQKDGLTSLLFQQNENKDSLLSKLKTKVSEIVSVEKKNQIPKINIISLNSYQKRRSSIILPNIAKGTLGTPKSQLSRKINRERRKSFFIPSLFEISNPTGKLSLISNKPIIDNNKDINSEISGQSKSQKGVIIVNKSENESNNSISDDSGNDDKSNNNNSIQSRGIQHFQMEKSKTSMLLKTVVTRKAQKKKQSS